MEHYIAAFLLCGTQFKRLAALYLCAAVLAIHSSSLNLGVLLLWNLAKTSEDVTLIERMDCQRDLRCMCVTSA